MMHVLALRGCSPSPLAHYLKAIGLFRLVAEQKDRAARAFWKDDLFHLASKLDEEALLRFLCDEVAPTPMVSPWNGGSGFYPKDNRVALDAIAGSSVPRFAKFREAIASARAETASRKERPANEDKDMMLTSCRRRWSNASLAWLDAAVSLNNRGEAKYPGLLGTGGNDGRLDFTNNLMQRWTELVDLETGIARAEARSTARTALFGGTGRGLVSAAIGQFHPGGAGGANATTGFDADSSFNPWDFVLALEGAATLRVASLRRLDGAGLSLAAAPFAVHGMAGGYGSATNADDEGRGEQWFPLWPAPATFAELRAVFAEGRLVCGAERPRGALDAARAIAQLGTARGLNAFQRYGFMVRNGLSNLAVPITRVETRTSPLPDARLLDEIAPWLDAVRRAAADDNAPPSIGRAARRLEAIIFDICIRTVPSARSWCELIEALGEAEDTLARSGRFTAAKRLRPLPALSARWLTAADDGSSELRLAAALATARAPKRGREADTLGPLRAHCVPLDAQRRFDTFACSDDALRDDPRVLWTGSDLSKDLARIVARRALESGRDGFEGLALTGGVGAGLDDLNAFVTDAIDDARLARLARGLMSIEAKAGDVSVPAAARAMPLYALFRVANLEAGGEAKRVLPKTSARCDPQTIRLLGTGRLEDATRIALTRLGAMGLRPKIRFATGDARLAVRLAASLAFPLAPGALERTLSAITKPHDELTKEHS